MSISAILSSAYNQNQVGASTNPFQQSIQQLSQDLQSGNLSAAQSDFATLKRAFSQASSTTGSASGSTSATSNPIAQAFNQLGTDLQAGNLSAAQKDFSTAQQDLQSRGKDSHYHLGSGNPSGQNALLQDLSQIGQNLTSANLSGAQQAYAAMGQELQQFALGGGSASQLSDLPLSLVA